MVFNSKSRIHNYFYALPNEPVPFVEISTMRMEQEKDITCFKYRSRPAPYGLSPNSSFLKEPDQNDLKNQLFRTSVNIVLAREVFKGRFTKESNYCCSV